MDGDVFMLYSGPPSEKKLQSFQAKLMHVRLSPVPDFARTKRGNISAISVWAPAPFSSINHSGMKRASIDFAFANSFGLVVSDRVPRGTPDWGEPRYRSSQCTTCHTGIPSVRFTRHLSGGSYSLELCNSCAREWGYLVEEN